MWRERGKQLRVGRDRQVRRRRWEEGEMVLDDGVVEGEG